MTRRAACLVVLAALLAAVSRPAAQPAAPVVLVGIDAFKPEYLERAEVPTLRRLAAAGIRAEGLIPPFPSKTFPSFTSIATGLGPARHGIVSNNMDDPGVAGHFTLSDHEVRSDPRWWRGEPIWNTAGRQGLRTGGMFWPGDDVEIGGRRPTYWLTYDEALPNEQRVDRVLEWLALPPAARPSLVTLYFGLVDEASHDHGPFSPEALAAAATADRLLARLVDGLAGRRQDVNLVVVSDHGMTETTPARVVVLDDLVNLARVDVVDSGPFLGLRPKPGGPSPESLVKALRGAGHLQAWRREDVPPRYRYVDPIRVPPVIGVADDGWLVQRRVARDQWQAAGGRVQGEHGYAPEVTAMRGLFVAAGPGLRPGLRVSAFANIHVYTLLCRLLGITPGDTDSDPEVTAAFLR